MGTIVANIKEIGIFMIAAQAVMHFAPGKQYEKYIKLIASVMVLLLFISPFVSGTEEIEAEWEAGIEQITQSLQEQDTGQASGSLWGSTAVQETALGQIEEEIRTRLNQELQGGEYQVTEVKLQLEETASAGAAANDMEWTAACVRIVMEKQGGSAGDAQETGTRENISIKIDEITIDRETDDSAEHMADAGTGNGEDGEKASAYRRMFADALGIGEDRVEVICRGGW